MLNLPREQIAKFSQALLEMKDKVMFCKNCFNLAEEETCHICKDESRNRKQICIVEEVSDVVILEKTGQYQGLYHVLGGLLSPIENIGPDDIRIPKIIQRIREGPVEEVIMALNPTVEGESTSMYIKKILHPTEVKITRLASGLPVGGDLEYADEVTIGRAITDRREL